MKHITIIHMGAVGDLVQALPALRAVRAKWPAAAVTLVGRPERALLAMLAGAADACMDFDSPRKAAALAEADLVIDFLSRGQPVAESRATQPRDPAARPKTPAPTPMPTQHRRGHATRHIILEPLPPADWQEPAAAWVLRQLSLPLALPPVPPEPQIPVPAALAASARALLAEKGVRGPFVAIHPGSGSRAKNWPAERFLKIARRVREEQSRKVVWLLGPAEEERGTLPAVPPEDVALWSLPLDCAAAVLAAADAYLGNDSGITHLAAAVRRPDGRPTPTVSLFGPTDAAVWAPRGKHVQVIRAAGAAMIRIGVEKVRAVVAATLTS
jgi:ADP-heptose:LPS heptosyltransferase